MISTPIHYIFSRKEIKIFLICTATGGLLQFFCRKYIKNHPEFLEEPEITIKIKNPSGKTEQVTNEIAEELVKDPIIRRIIKHLRGGQFQEKLVEVLFRLMLKKLIKLAAARGVEFGVSLGTGIAFAVTPKKALVKVIEGALPQNLLDKKSFIQVNGEKVYLENCENGFKYMFSILMDKELPYNEKKELVTYIFRVNLDKSKPLKLVLCLIPMLLILATQNPASYFLVIKNLIQAIKEGKISKRVARIIVRRLLKEGKMVDPELLDIIE